MKISLIEVGHWHAGSYIKALKEYDADVVAVSDRNIDVARELPLIWAVITTRTIEI